MDGIITFANVSSEFLKLLIQLLIIVIAILLTWYVRTYVKSSEQQKRMAAIVQLSNAAINYAEDLDQRGELDDYLKKWNLSDEAIKRASTGEKKLNIAGKFAKQEMERLGIKMTDEEAQAWIAAGFQQLVGDLYQSRSYYQQTQIALRLLRALEQAGLLSLPSDTPQNATLANQVTAGAIDQPDEDSEEAALREEALVKTGTELATQAKPRVETPGAGLETILAHLAKQSVAYVEQLKIDRDLTFPELDVAVAWMVTEVTKRGLEAPPDQIANAVRAAFAERGAE